MNAATTAAGDEARRGLAASADGHIPRPARMRLLRALADERPDPVGHTSYPAVAALAGLVGRALPVWNAERPQDGRPTLLLQAALSSRETLAAAEPRADELLDETRLAMSAGELPDAAAFAAQSAVLLVYDALLGFDDAISDDREDDTIEYESWDADYLAVGALAGWTEASPPVRRELWTWWLDEVVPAAAASGLRPQ